MRGVKLPDSAEPRGGGSDKSTREDAAVMVSSERIPGAGTYLGCKVASAWVLISAGNRSTPDFGGEKAEGE